MDYIQKLIAHQTKHGQHSIIDDVLKNMDAMAFNDLIKNWSYSLVKLPNKVLIHDILVQFHSPYLAARVIGRQGECVKLIQRITDARITSPKSGYKRSDRQVEAELSFHIESRFLFNALHAFAFIVMVGMFFSQKFEELITPEFGEISEKIQVPPYIVPVLCKKDARFIQMIRENFAIRIVSPKPYCPPCFFYFVGKKACVIKAMKIFTVCVQKILYQLES